MQQLVNLPFLQFLHYLVRQFFRNQGVLNAAALTYTTLFAVVPLMTVSYAMLAAIPSFQGVSGEIQSLIFDNFVPATGTVVQQYLADFSGQARKLTAVGVFFLMVTSVMMMKNIEAAFNRIWRVSRPRRGLSSFLLYWAILSLGPVLIGLGILTTSYIATLPFISSATEAVGRTRMLSLIAPLLSSAAFTLIYVAVPNCRVPFKNALIGGVVVAILFEAAKRGFAMFVTQFPSYELIYGAFAAVPLFLVWVFISWTIILLGCELTRGLSVYRQSDYQGREPHLVTVISVLYRLWKAQQVGQVLSDQQLLQEVEGLDQGRWDEYTTLLIDGGVISRTEQGDYLLCRDLSALSIEQLHDLLPWPIPDPDPDLTQVTEVWRQQVDHRLLKIVQIREEQFATSLEDLFLEERNPVEPTEPTERVAV